MKRRTFFKFTTISVLALSTQLSIAKTIQKDVLVVLDEVYEVLFPKTSNMPSSREFNVINYLLDNINNKSFLDYDKTLVLEGTQDFIANFPEFLTLKQEEKKELIYSIVNTNDYAQTWISKLLTFGIEALFADPLYGGNTSQVGWNSINHKIGYPRPQKRYGQRL